MHRENDFFDSYEEAVKNFDPYRNNPQSIHYKRVHSFPKINIIRIILNIVISGIIAVFLYLLLKTVLIPKQYGVLASVIVIVLYLGFICCRLKFILICLVQLYQRIAPIRIRDKCRFEPSCSDYMIMSIEKFGVIRGVKKGINRIYRCSKKDGGYDYP